MGTLLERKMRRFEQLDAEDAANEDTRKKLQTHCDELEAQQPQAVLQKAEADLADNDDGSAHRTIVEWFEKQGSTAHFCCTSDAVF